jgi:DNA-binding CsgD family transcriptional regulator
MQKKYYLVKLIVFIAILFLAFRYEQAMPQRQVYLIILSSFLLLSTFVRFFIRMKNNLLVGFVIFDTMVVFMLERLSRYVVNYALHILFLLILVEIALTFEKKYFNMLGVIVSITSLSKYIYMLILVRNFSTIAESIAVSLFTIITFISLYLLKIIQGEKEKVVVLYNEITRTHQDLAIKYKRLNLEFEPDPLVTELTDREIDVCKLVAKGLSNNEIAKKLYISEGTVKNHITSIFRKLDIRDRTQLAIFTIKNRL